MAENKFYITTPIYYVTAKPHLGSLYSTLLADVLARWNMLQDKQVFFLTGTDEHGQKIAQASAKVGMEPKAFVDSFIPAYQNAWKAYEIDYTKFIRTTDTEHIRAVQTWLEQLERSGAIYKAEYQGWYCVSCETFITEKELELHAGDVAPSCISCGRPTTFVSEETYFFRLSDYEQRLLQFYEDNPDFIQPKERMAEVVSFVKTGLKDLSISRTTVTWGIPFKNDPKHVTYVWADALANYITAVGFNQPGKEKEFAHWWPADVQVLGKDILRFHAVYWLAFLMASGLPLPKQLLVHGWIKVGQQKMSKSLGNVIDPMVLSQVYGVEPVRYYLMKQLAITHDGEFSIDDLEQKISSDLANDLGNLLNRFIMLAEKYDMMVIKAPSSWSAQAVHVRDESITTIEQVKVYMDQFLVHMALATTWKFIHTVNAYFHASEPWKLAKSDRKAFEEVLSVTAHSLRTIALLVWPIMPSKMEQLLQSLGVSFNGAKLLDRSELGSWKQTFICVKIPVLFERPQPKESETSMEETKAVAIENLITIDDFAKVQIVTGTVEKAELVEKSDKLLKLQVNFGQYGIKQVFSGIRKYYTPETIIGKQGIFVLNLQPRKIMGEESQGMMLFAQDEAGKLQIVSSQAPVPNGTQLK